MKQVLTAILAIIIISCSCKSTGSMAAIEPKSGTIDLPQKGEFRIWNNVTHPSFSVTLTNNNPQQSCEVYTLKSNGNEKWVSPSLKANSSLTVTVPANGHLFFKNFNPNTLTISYSVNQ